jgi:endoplasmic reticulum Man9GlcNAc2 1,2-alpha-mannosidase
MIFCLTEYLIKQYLQTSGQEGVYLDMWDEALSGIRKRMITVTKEANLKIVGELPHGVGNKLSPKMDHLACFLPGAIALGATRGRPLEEAKTMPGWSKDKKEQIELAKELTKTCWGSKYTHSMHIHYSHLEHRFN